MNFSDMTYGEVLETLGRLGGHNGFAVVYDGDAQYDEQLGITVESLAGVIYSGDGSYSDDDVEAVRNGQRPDDATEWGTFHIESPYRERDEDPFICLRVEVAGVGELCGNHAASEVATSQRERIKAIFGNRPLDN